MIDPHDTLTTIERLAGTLLPDELRTAIVGALDDAQRRYDQHMTNKPDGDALPSELGAWDKDRRALAKRQTDALLAASDKLRRRHGDELIRALQPRHAEVVDVINGIDDTDPQLAGIDPETAADHLDAERLERWRQRRQAYRDLIEIESTVEQHIRSPHNGVRVETVPRGTASTIDTDEPSRWWSDVPYELLRAFDQSIPRLGPAMRNRPTWPECRQHGATRKLKTSSEVAIDTVSQHNARAERSPGRTAFGQPAVCQVTLPGKTPSPAPAA